MKRAYNTLEKDFLQGHVVIGVIPSNEKRVALDYMSGRNSSL